MSQTYNKPEYKVLITTQDKLNTAIAGGTAEEGLPYGIVGKCPEIYGNGQVQSVAPTTSTVGEVGDLYIALINNVVREWECVSVNGTTYLWREKLIDVSIDGASIMYNGEAIIPKADGTTLGVLKSIKIGSGSNIIDGNGDANIPIAGANLGVVKPGSGLAMNSTTGSISVNRASNSAIESKSEDYNPIVPSNLDKAVMEGLGNNSLTWSDAYKTSARNTIGAATSEIVADWDNLRTL